MYKRQAKDLRALRGQLGVKGFVVPKDPKGRWAPKGCKDLSEAKALLEVKDPLEAKDLLEVKDLLEAKDQLEVKDLLELPRRCTSLPSRGAGRQL